MSVSMVALSSPRIEAAKIELRAARAEHAAAQYAQALADCDRTEVATAQRLAFGSIDATTAQRIRQGNEARRQALREAAEWHAKRAAAGAGCAI